MWAKSYLQQLRKLDIQIKHRMHELDAFKASMGLTGIDYGKDPIQVTAGNGQEATIIRCLDLEREIKESIEQLTQIRHRIIKEIHALNNTVYMDLLYMRYVEYKRLEEIAVATGYSYCRTKHLHGEALRNFESRHPIAPLPVLL